jgi:hypothetical protein
MRAIFAKLPMVVIQSLVSLESVGQRSHHCPPGPQSIVAGPLAQDQERTTATCALPAHDIAASRQQPSLSLPKLPLGMGQSRWSDEMPAGFLSYDEKNKFCDRDHIFRQGRGISLE